MREGYDFYDSPIGMIYYVVNEVGVSKVELFEEEWEEYLKSRPDLLRDKELCQEVTVQIEQYFKGQRKDFNLPLDIQGTEFRKKVWKALLDIPYGKAVSYLDIAVAIGNPKAVRAVGQANRHNMIPLIIPCHRVIGKSGGLVGFAGNRTPTQALLLAHEGYEI